MLLKGVDGEASGAENHPDPGPMKAILIRATGEQIEVNVPPPAPPTITHHHPHDRMRLDVFDLFCRMGPPGSAVYRERA